MIEIRHKSSIYMIIVTIFVLLLARHAYGGAAHSKKRNPRFVGSLDGTYTQAHLDAIEACFAIMEREWRSTETTRVLFNFTDNMPENTLMTTISAHYEHEGTSYTLPMIERITKQQSFADVLTNTDSVHFKIIINAKNSWNLDPEAKAAAKLDFVHVCLVRKAHTSI